MRSFGGTSSTYWFCTMERTSVKSFSCSYVALLSALLLATDPPSDSVSTTRSELITNAFFMDALSSLLGLATLAEPLFGVLGPALVAHLEVERSEEHTSELQSRVDLVCRLLLEKKKSQHNSEL